MKTFYYMGPNRRTAGGVSWKMWRIERRARTVTAWWGAATVDKRRKVTPVYRLQSKSWTFRTEAQAKECEASKIAEKLRGGYSRTVSRRA